MLVGKRVVVVLPAYQAEGTLRATFQAIPDGVVDEVLLVDDGSSDGTVTLAASLGIETFRHERNLGYGANQKTCYREALRKGADVVVMVHPDYQYEPRLITAMGAMVASGVYDVVLGSRILGNTALSGGMPPYKWIANRLLTLFQNVVMGTKLSEYHTGLRAFSRRALETLPLLANSNDFVFDNQMLAQAVAAGLPIGEISCPTRYFPGASSISFRRALVYGCGVLATTLFYRLWRWRVWKSRLFDFRPELRLTGRDSEPQVTRR